MGEVYQQKMLFLSFCYLGNLIACYCPCYHVTPVHVTEAAANLSLKVLPNSPHLCWLAIKEPKAGALGGSIG